MATVLSALAQTTPKTPPPPGYAGSLMCRGCHPDISAAFFRNPHFKTANNSKLPFEDKGCESCHGPGKAHIEAKGDKSKIVAFSQLQPKQTLDACLACHSRQISRANIRRSSHTTADVVCTNCHSVHKSATPKQLLARPQTDLCYSCHSNVQAQFSMPVKHRVNEGFMQCSDCHNPHGSDAPTWRMSARPRMMAHGLQNEEPCLKCHVDKRGPFVFEHAALRVDGCASCHLPHGSMNARLLKRPQVFTVCLECHNGAASFGRQNDGIQITPATHSLTDPKYQNCTLCHSRIHGSNANGSFLR
ncbi:MAG: DmsE family decaheme c-type cytochrome [Acidobacteriota bacterium]